MFSSRHPLPSASCRRGFTLTEVAIVLGVLAFLLGAIWEAYSTVHNNMIVEQFQGDIMTTVQNIRTFYQSSPQFHDAAGTNITDKMIKAEAFPSSLLSLAPQQPVTPWGGTIRIIVADSPTRAKDSFTLTMTSPIPKDICRQILVLSAGKTRDPGLINVVGGGLPAMNTDADIRNLSYSKFPSNAACDTLSLTYKLGK